MTENKNIQANIEKLFQKDWNWEHISKKNIHPNILFCPIDCREKIEFLLKNTKKSLFWFQQYITDENIKKIITKKITDNVKVQLKLPNKDWNKILQKELGNLSTTKKPGLLSEAVLLFENPYIHSKTFLIDDKYLILGSMNMSSNSLNNNREIWIVIMDKKIIEQWKKEFEKW